MDVLNVALGFASGVGVTFFGALVNAGVQSRRQKRRELAKAQTDVYYRLMMLRTQWWGMVLAEFHQEEISTRVRREIHDTAWKLADVLREADDINDLEDIVAVLFSEDFDTAQDRYDAIDHIISRLGHKANPKYIKAVERASAINMTQGMEKPARRFSAPTSLL